MRKLRKAAVAAVMIGGFTCIATVPATAQPMYDGHGGGCQSHDFNLSLLGQVGLLNGLAGNLLNGEGNPGAQYNNVGSSC